MPGTDDLAPLRQKPFSEAVDKLEELILQGAPAFLLGAGCSKCGGLPLTAELTAKAIESAELDETSKGMLAAVQDSFDGSADAHIEDFLSELVDLLAIAERREARGTNESAITLAGTKRTSTDLRKGVAQIKRAIAGVLSATVNIGSHLAFVRAVHRPTRAGRPDPGRVVDYIVLNYDTAIEDALALERISYADGIDGGPTGWWNPRTFDREGLSARVLKLHGSIDWREDPRDPMPRRIGNAVQTEGSEGRNILIWPASTKYRETQRDPFAQLAERVRKALRPGVGAQKVLVACGYAFGDEHVNSEVERALRDSRGDLTFVAFTSNDAPSSHLKGWLEDGAIRDQILVYAKRGYFQGEASSTSSEDLPWWKFEVLARLLRGER